MPRVSLIMIVRDEAAVLARCLASVAGLVDEIVVVDTGSTDDTRRIAAGFGARVSDFQWIEDFSAARNECLKQAAGDWVFWLDADEWLEPAEREKLRQRLQSLPNELIGYSMVQRSPTRLNASTELQTQSLRQVRLFPKHPQAKWEGRVFEQVRPSIRRAGGVIHESDVVIEHGGYADADAMARRAERNLRLVRLQLADTPDDPYVQAALADLLVAAGRNEEAKPVLEACRGRLQPGSVSHHRVLELLARLQEI